MLSSWAKRYVTGTGREDWVLGAVGQALADSVSEGILRSVGKKGQLGTVEALAKKKVRVEVEWHYSLSFSLF